MKKLALVISNCLIWIVVNAQNVVITEAPGLLNQDNKVVYFNYPYLYHGGTSTSGNTQSIFRYNINDFTDNNANTNIYTYSSFGMGNTTLNNEVFILQGASFYKVNLASGIRTNLQNYPCIYINERATVVNDGSNYIYVIGGRLSGTTLSNELWRYDIANNVWNLQSNAPQGFSFNSGAFIYPYIYTGGGHNAGSGVQNNNIYRYNILNNSWASISTPQLGPVQQGCCTTTNSIYELYFEYNNEFYCLFPGENSFWPLGIHKYNSTTNIWSAYNLASFPGGLANIGTVPISSLTRIQSIGNGNYIFLKDGVYGGLEGQTLGYTLSFSNKQTHVKINNTNCVDLLNSSTITLNYSLQLSGVYSNSTIQIIANDGVSSSMTLRTLNNLSSNSQQTLNFSDIVPVSYQNGYIEAIVTEESVTTNSINKYPISKNITNAITAAIQSSNGTNFCTGIPIGTVLSVQNVAGYTYQWYLNGNPITSSTTYQYTATQVGTYSCLVTASNGCTSQPNITIQQIAPPAQPTISASGPTTFCSGGSVTLTSSSSTGNTWSTGVPTQSITVTQSGNYTVSVSNGSCSTSSGATSIVINSIPATPTISASGPTTFCSGGSVTLTSSSASGNTWSIGATTQSIIVTQGGNYTVSVSNGNCSSSSTATVVTVNPVPSTPTISASGLTTFCSGGSVNLTSSSSTGNTWSTGATTQSIIVTQSGNYTVSVSNGNCSNSSAVTQLNVNPIPNSTINASSPTTFCSGGSVTLTSSSSSGNTWSTGATTQSITLSQSGSYILTVSDGQCSSTSIPVVITVNPIPNPPTISSIGNTTFCQGDSVLIASSYFTGNTWSNGQIANSIYVNQSGFYTVQFVDNNGCSSTSNPFAITVLPLPQVNVVSSGSTTLCQGESITLTSSPANSYFWSNGSLNQSIIINQSGSYSVIVNGTNGCSNISSPIFVVVNPNTSSSLNQNAINSFTLNGQTYTQSGTYTQVIPNVYGCDSTITLNLTLSSSSLNESSANFRVYPNPTFNNVTVKAFFDSKQEFSIIDAVGRILYIGELLPGENIIYLNNYARGIYSIITAGNSTPIRIIKE